MKAVKMYESWIYDYWNAYQAIVKQMRKKAVTRLGSQSLELRRVADLASSSITHRFAEKCNGRRLFSEELDAVAWEYVAKLPLSSLTSRSLRKCVLLSL
jgi:hypothetical protein